MKVLAIGNSFSADATRYLHEIAKAGGVPLKVVNLFIGGCPLHTHYKNINNDARAYSLEYNGHSTGFTVSIREALQSDIWDFVSMQQASVFSVNYDTYQPYLRALSDYISLHAPKAKQAFRRTWAYENGSHRLMMELGYETHSAMFGDIKSASAKALAEVGIDCVIPSGELIESMVLAGIDCIYRDSFHLSKGVGRYAVAALWYEKLTGKSIASNNFCEFDEEIDTETLSIVKKLVGKASS